MTFNPNYCPETVDFVIVHDLQEKFLEPIRSYYRAKQKKLGMNIKFRTIGEAYFWEICSNNPSENLEDITKDSIVFVHGAMGIKMRGVKAALDSMNKSDARIIVEYAHTYSNELYQLLIEKNYKLEAGFPFSPERQISFLERTKASLIGEDDDTYSILNYLKQLLALRGEK